jgi:hypothetical protein
MNKIHLSISFWKDFQAIHSKALAIQTFELNVAITEIETYM